MTGRGVLQTTLNPRFDFNVDMVVDIVDGGGPDAVALPCSPSLSAVVVEGMKLVFIAGKSMAVTESGLNGDNGNVKCGGGG